MHKHPLIVANWKMNTTLADAIIMTQAVKQGLEEKDDVKVVIAAPYVWLAPLAEKLAQQPIRQLSLASQDVSSFAKGAYTGEVAAFQLKDLVEYGIVGHSERVAHFFETPERTNQKLEQLLENQIMPIVCLGEEKKGKSGSVSDHLIAQAKIILKGLTLAQLSGIVLAYEPVWAISSHPGAEPAEGEYVGQVADRLVKSFPGVKVIYGGSVDSQNMAEFMHEEQIEGALVGQASLNVKEFLKIVEQV